MGRLFDVNGAYRLAKIVSALDRLGIPYLVMGGHAARYYGVERNTIDYDLHVGLDDWAHLDTILRLAFRSLSRAPTRLAAASPRYDAARRVRPDPQGDCL